MVVSFRVRAPFAIFKKAYTKTSSETYLFPPKTAIIGLIAAIKGWERDSYDSYLEKTLVGVRVNNIPKIVPFNLNFDNTKKQLEKTTRRIPIAGYVLREVDYTFYINDNSVYEDLNNLKPTYTPYLGTSNMLIRIEEVSKIDVKVVKKDRFFTNSVVQITNETAKFIPKENSLIYREVMPIMFNNTKNGRIPVFGKFIFSEKGMEFVDNPIDCIELNSEIIALF